MQLLTEHAFLCRRRRPFGGGDPGDHDEDFGIPGGNDGDSGSTGGGGGGDWGSDGGEEGGYFGDLMGALWLWRALCVCSVLQVTCQTSTLKSCLVEHCVGGCLFSLRYMSCAGDSFHAAGTAQAASPGFCNSQPVLFQLWCPCTASWGIRLLLNLTSTCRNYRASMPAVDM